MRDWLLFVGTCGNARRGIGGVNFWSLLGYRRLNVLVCELSIGELGCIAGIAWLGWRLCRLCLRLGCRLSSRNLFWLLVGAATSRSEVKTGFSLVVARLLLLGQLFRCFLGGLFEGNLLRITTLLANNYQHDSQHHNDSYGNKNPRDSIHALYSARLNPIGHHLPYIN